ncbi:Glycerophosphodiester phosphodiesterase GDPD5 [Hibiscus syriacus]|uniref:glycerophosphodiester phosphodiesterase n=1 Tax=Hibiscus syriacus TaxID=106335 RepID=A0A6A3BYD9_HIBSY|nr:Glycerophosphodiester phosphodiesterase GDPD5 [Hibiscus syriacus]
MISRSFVPFLCLSLIAARTARPFYPLPSKIANRNRQPLQTSHPYNIAHRGSNGEIPEASAAAYMRAIAEGADFIEADILSSKDGVLMCFHDVTLDETTDVADYKEFANCRRNYDIQGVNTTGFFSWYGSIQLLAPFPSYNGAVEMPNPVVEQLDFTLEELKKLRVKQRYKFGDQQYNGMFLIITFEEFISIALDAPRVVGIYPEIKNPSFAPTSLVYVSNLTDSPKIFLINDVTIPTRDTNQSYWEITSDEYLDFIKEYVIGTTDLMTRAHARDLQVNPHTYRNENSFLLSTSIKIHTRNMIVG